MSVTGQNPPRNDHAICKFRKTVLAMKGILAANILVVTPIAPLVNPIRPLACANRINRHLLLLSGSRSRQTRNTFHFSLTRLSLSRTP